jgi:hypothetical protein
MKIQNEINLSISAMIMRMSKHSGSIRAGSARKIEMKSAQLFIPNIGFENQGELSFLSET